VATVPRNREYPQSRSGSSTDGDDRAAGHGVGVIALNLHLVGALAPVVTAALLMVFAGTHKKALRWKPAERRCRTCGRSDRYNCPCRR
jgi:hypothetical protein